jgi:D-alanine-D-alanine ligase
MSSSRLTVCLLFGGRSGEHEVSLRSAASVAQNLDPDRYRQVLIGIDRQGVWHLQEPARFVRKSYGEELEIAPSRTPVNVIPGAGLSAHGRRIAADVVFPVLHGTFGEDGTVQGLLEMAGLAYVGSGVLASSLAMDKEKTKEIWRQRDLPVVDWLTVRDASPASLQAVRSRFPFPVFVKPATAGSSVGITKVRDEAGLDAALAEALRFDAKALVEPAVDAREIECAVLGNQAPQAFPPGEIIPRHEFYSYEAKYLDPEGAELRIPAELPAERSAEVMRLAAAAFRAVEASGLARVDCFAEKNGGRIWLNEINTLPGFTNISMYPKLCEAAGVRYPALLDRLIELARERHRLKASLLFSLPRL